MSYLDLGFDEFMNPVDGSSTATQEMDPLESDTYIQQISANKLQGGLASSPDGRLKIDFDNGSLRVNDGTADLIQIGVLEDGSIGFLIKDNNGNVLIKFAAGTNIIQSATGRFITDYSLEQFLLKDEKGVPIGLWGVQQDGF
jgi:hypothetical protein